MGTIRAPRNRPGTRNKPRATKKITRRPAPKPRTIPNWVPKQLLANMLRDIIRAPAMKGEYVNYVHGEISGWKYNARKNFLHGRTARAIEVTFYGKGTPVTCFYDLEGKLLKAE